MNAPLPADLRRLCGRLATERLRPQEWADARALRLHMHKRLKAGELAADLADELQRAIAAAVQRQA